MLHQNRYPVVERRFWKVGSAGFEIHVFAGVSLQYGKAARHPRLWLDMTCTTGNSLHQRLPFPVLASFWKPRNSNHLVYVLHHVLLTV
jgi:hypothetical protein